MGLVVPYEHERGADALQLGAVLRFHARCSLCLKLLHTACRRHNGSQRAGTHFILFIVVEWPAGCVTLPYSAAATLTCWRRR